MTTMTRERPILFSEPMVRALLAGTKTQTRRVVKPQPVSHDEAEPGDVVWFGNELSRVRESRGRNKRAIGHLNAHAWTPYGAPGDMLRVNESWRAERKHDPYPPRDIPEGSAIWYEADDRATPLAESPWGRLRPGRFMMGWMSRIRLEVVSVRVERVESITEEDAIAEGVTSLDEETMNLLGGGDKNNNANSGELVRLTQYPADCFLALFYDLNKRAPRGSNPWVWRIAFRRLP